MNINITEGDDGVINIQISPSQEVPPWAVLLTQKVDLVLTKEDKIMSAQTDALDQAEAAAKANSDADDAAEALLLKLVDLYNQAVASSTDPAVVARIQALGTTLTDRSTRLAAAVTANTPAAKPVP